MARLAAVLTPYCKWNQVRPFDEPEPNDGGFTVLQVRPLLHALLDRVHDVTGHPRPKGWPRKRPGSATPARCLTSPPPNGGNYAPSRYNAARRSERRRVGKEGGRTGSSRWSPIH